MYDDGEIESAKRRDNAFFPLLLFVVLLSFFLWSFWGVEREYGHFIFGIFPITFGRGKAMETEGIHFSVISLAPMLSYLL